MKAALLGAALLIAATPPTPEPSSATFTYDVMATRFELRIVTDGTEENADAARAAAGAVGSILVDVDERMSEWKPTSPLSKVNREAGVSAVAVPADLREVVRRGREIGERTDGAFDITWAALWGLWDFRAETPVVPDAAEVARRAALVDYRRVRVDDDTGTVFLEQVDMKLGLGGIAKGWALDRAAAELRSRGFPDFLLAGGGQILAGGTRGGTPWRVGIRDPRGPADDFFALLTATDVSVSTSGDYERYFVVDGVRYHHIIDPRTGMPARGLRSVTAVCADATLADAMSTAILVAGADRGKAIAEATDGLEAVLVDDSGAVHVTSGLKDHLEIVHPPAPEGPRPQ